MMRNFNEKYSDYMEASTYVNGVIVEYVEGIGVIKTFNQSTTSYEKFEKAIYSFKEYTLDWFRSTWKLMNFGGAVLPSTLLGTLPIGILLYKQGKFKSSRAYYVYDFISLGIIGPLTSFTVFINDLKSY